jgi:hypothetical protein
MKRNSNEHDLILCEISRHDIELFDFENILTVLNKLKEEPANYVGKFAFIVSGYDNDKREIYEIPEIRSYFAFLDRTFPYWLFFFNLNLPTNQSPLMLLISCLMDVEVLYEESDKKKFIKVDMPQLTEFIQSHLPYFNEMIDKAGISEEVEEQIFNNMMQHVYKTIT